MNWREKLENQIFYIEGKKELEICKQRLINLSFDYESIDSIEIYNKLKIGSASSKEAQVTPYLIATMNQEYSLNRDIISYLETVSDDEAKEYRDSLISKNSIIEKNVILLLESYGEYTSSLSDIDDELESVKDEDKYTGTKYEDFLSENSKGQTTIDDTFGNYSFEDLIDEADNPDLRSWYLYLQNLHESPMKSFTINKNTICNFRLVFRNPYTGLSTDKEAVVHISHSTSAKKSPVFGIGSVSYQATSTGVKLLAGSLVTAALENIPLPYLHAISYMNHTSVEDLPPLDLYIIPIENINDDGRYEVLQIKGIHFTDMKQNDNASSTGIYYAFSYFAEDIVPLDFSEARKYFNINEITNSDNII